MWRGAFINNNKCHLVILDSIKEEEIGELIGLLFLIAYQWSYVAENFYLNLDHLSQYITFYHKNTSI